jgi:hypothetical protein
MMVHQVAVGCTPFSDGVLETRNDFLDITRQYTLALDHRPQRHWR